MPISSHCTAVNPASGHVRKAHLQEIELSESSSRKSTSQMVAPQMSARWFCFWSCCGRRVLDAFACMACPSVHEVGRDEDRQVHENPFAHRKVGAQAVHVYRPVPVGAVVAAVGLD